MKKYQVSQGCCFCGECMYVCPKGAITMDRQGAHINPDKCVGCGICADNCASEAIVAVQVQR